MYDLILKNDGKIVTKDGEKLIRNPLPYLTRFIELEDGYTLRSYFRTLISNKRLTCLDNYIQSFIQECAQCYNTEVDDIDIEHIEVRKEIGVEINSYGEELIEYITVHGKAQNPELAQSDYYAIEMSPLKGLINLPIKIAPVLFYQVDNTKYPYDQIKKNYVDNKLTLFEFITSIICELSFHGTPTMRDDAVKELKKRIDNIDNGIGVVDVNVDGLDFIKKFIEK